MVLREVSTTELRDIISTFGLGKAPGFDNISMKVISLTFEHVIEPLRGLINLSLNTGTFPDKLKIAKVIPIFKADDPEQFNNYRPISILPAFSKLFEKVVYNRIYDFLIKQDILYKKQFGFRRNHSTSLALVQLVNNIASSVDNNEISAGIFLDMSKAFDTLNHQILSEKLEFYGIRGSAHNWIASYLTERKQFVQFGSSSSFYKTITCGVPQGSILGPLLFIIYINDLPNASKIMQSLLFADDTSMFYSHKNLSHVISVLNNELTHVVNWLRANKLSLNVGKTNYMIFRPKQKKLGPHDPLVIDNKTIKQVEVTKFLGVFIDEYFTWKSHISFVNKKMSKTIGIMNKSRLLLSSKTMISLYYTLVYPYLNYCNIAWSSTYPSNLNRIHLLQKRVVRIIANADYRAHTAPLFRKLKILDVFNVNSFLIASFMYSYHNQLLPDNFHRLFLTNRDIHNYNTRQVIDYRSHHCRTNIKQFTILYQGPKIWNSLPRKLLTSPSISVFKKAIKQYLIENRKVN